MKRKRENEALDDHGQYAVKHYKDDRGNAAMRWQTIGGVRLRVLQRGVGQRKAKEGDKVLLLYEMRRVPSAEPLLMTGSVDGFELLASQTTVGEPVRSLFFASVAWRK